MGHNVWTQFPGGDDLVKEFLNKQFNDFAEQRNRVENAVNTGTFAATKTLDQVWNGFTRNLNFRDNKRAPNGLEIGLLAPNYIGETLLPVPSNVVAKLKMGNGESPPRHIRVKNQFIPDGTLLADPTNAMFLEKLMADGGTSKNGTSKIRAWLSEGDVGTNRYMHYYGAFEPGQNEMVETGRVTTQDLEEHLKTYGKVVDTVVTKDAAGKVSSEDIYDIQVAGKFVGRQNSTNKAPEYPTGNASARIYVHRGGDQTAMRRDGESINDFVTRAGGSLEKENWLVLGGLPVDPMDRFKAPKLSGKAQIIETVFDKDGNKTTRPAPTLRWLSEPDTERSTLNFWSEAERAALMQQVEDAWETNFPGLDKADRTDPAFAAAYQRFDKVVAEIWNDARNAPNLLKYYGFVDRNSKPVSAIGFTRDAWHAHLDGDTNALNNALYGASAWSSFKAGNATALDDVKTKDFGFNASYSGMWQRVYNADTNKPMFEHRGDGAFESENFNRPLFGVHVGGYMADIDMYDYMVKNVSKPGMDAGQVETAIKQSLDKGQRIADKMYSADIMTARQGDRSPRLFMTVSSKIKQPRDMMLGAKNLFREIAYMGGGGVAGAAVAIGGTLALGAASAWVVAPVALVGASLGAFAGLQSGAEARHTDLHVYEKLANFQVARQYKERGTQKGFFGIKALREDGAIFLRGLKGTLASRYETRENIQRVQDRGNIVTALGAIGLAGVTGLAVATGAITGVGIAVGAAGLVAGAAAAITKKKVTKTSIGLGIAGTLGAVAATAVTGGLAAPVIGVAIASAVTAGAGVATRYAGKLAYDGYIHIVDDMKNSVSKRMEKNKGMEGKEDHYMRFAWGSDRGPEHEKFYKETTEESKALEEKIGLNRDPSAYGRRIEKREKAETHVKRLKQEKTAENYRGAA